MLCSQKQGPRRKWLGIFSFHSPPSIILGKAVIARCKIEVGKMTETFKSSRDVIVRAKDLAEATKFYTSVLGFRMTSKDANLAGFESGSFCLYVERGPRHGPVFELLVPNVAEAKARLLAAGCIVVEENPAIPRCYIRDPYGFTFNVARAPMVDPPPSDGVAA
jgi:predicted enzyme related to lactoylglutathione lyase